MFSPIHDTAKKYSRFVRFHSNFFEDLTEAQALIIDATILSAPSSEDLLEHHVAGFRKMNKLARWGEAHESEQFLVFLTIFIGTFNAWHHVDKTFLMKLKQLTNEQFEDFFGFGITISEDSRDLRDRYWLNISKKWHHSLVDSGLKPELPILFFGSALYLTMSQMQLKYLHQFAKFFDEISIPEISQYLSQA